METAVEPVQIFVGLTGPPGGGKTRDAAYLHSLPIEAIDHRLPDLGINDVEAVQMRQMLGWHGYKDSLGLRQLRDYHHLERQAGNGPAIIDRLKQLGSGLFIIDSFRDPRDALYFKEELGGFLLTLTAPYAVCEERTLKDDNDEKHTNILASIKLEGASQEEIKAAIKRAKERYWELAWEEMFNDSTNQPGIYKTMKLSDATIDTEGMTVPEVANRTIEVIHGFVSRSIEVALEE